MTNDQGNDLNPLEVAAYRARLDAMTVEDLIAFRADPKAQQALAWEVRLEVALDALDVDELITIRDSMPSSTDMAAPSKTILDPTVEADPRLVAAYQVRLDAMMDPMSEEQLRALANPEALKSLEQEAWLAAKLDSLDNDEVARLRDSLDAGTESSVFSDAEWAIINSQPSGREFADPAYRYRFEHMLRSDPAMLQSMRRNLADIRSDREAALSPMAKQWLIRVAIALVVGLIILAIQQR